MLGKIRESHWRPAAILAPFSELQTASSLHPCAGKPASIVDKMVMGRLQKFYQEVCLLEQPFVMDDSKRVSGGVWWEACERQVGERQG